MMCRFRVSAIALSLCFLAQQTNGSQAQDLPALGEAQAPVTPPLGAWIESARELLVAAESAERVVARVATMVETTSENMAKMSGQFDPFGFKTAFQTIEQQNRTIQRLMEAEVRRLENEVKALKRQRKKEAKRRKPA